MRKIMLMSAATALAGCGAVTLDDRVDEREQQLLDSLQAVALAQVVSFQQAGINPIQLSPSQRTFAAVGCGLIASTTTVLWPEGFSPESMASWCETFQLIAE